VERRFLLAVTLSAGLACAIGAVLGALSTARRRHSPGPDDAAGQRHEIGNALHALEGAATTIAEGADALPSQTMSELGDAMASEVDRLRGLVTARTERPHPYDLVGVLGPLVNLHAGRGLPVRLVAPRFAVTYGRPSVPAQIVANLLQNVERHAPGAATTVQVTAGRCEVTVTVTNDRPPRHAAADPHPNGQGVGLPTSARLARSEGGSLHAQGRPDGGYSAILSLPAGGVPRHPSAAHRAGRSRVSR
jgi:signal transduction histidine kinase